jgi:peptidoglycan-associated lipoprotein
MNKICGLSLLLVLFTSGCGKKKSDVKKADSKKIASLDKDLAVFTSDKEELVDNESVNDFAFVDDEDMDGAHNLVVSADELGRASENKTKALTSAASGSNELLVSADQAEVDQELGFKRVQFDFNKNSIRKDQVKVVDADVQAAKKAVEQGKKVVVQGHTCQMGPAAYNMALSQRRAESVKEKMLASGLDASEVKTVGYGYEYPIAYSDSTDRATKIKELAVNRRAEIITD